MINYFYCSVPSIALRKYPEHQSEQISQILFGEEFQILEINEKWAKIECKWDHYIGWIPIQKGIWQADTDCSNSANSVTVISDLVILIGANEFVPLYLSTGSIIRAAMFPKGFQILRGQTASYSISPLVNPVELRLDISQQWLGTPYHWGGRSRFGTDCSGFTQVIFGVSGTKLPRDAKDQLRNAPTRFDLSDPNAYSAGNLAFFGPEINQISHVGIISQPNRIIHASGLVREDHFSKQGIHLSEEPNIISHKLQAIATYQVI